MNSGVFWEITLPNTLTSGLLPLLMGLVGCIVCMVSYQRAPRAAVWALLGFLLLILASLFQVFSYNWLTGFMLDNNWSSSDKTSAQRGLSVFWSLLKTLSYGCLLAAVFAQRGVRSPLPPLQQPAWGGYPPAPPQMQPQPMWQPPPPRV